MSRTLGRNVARKILLIVVLDKKNRLVGRCMLGTAIRSADEQKREQKNDKKSEQKTDDK